MSAIANTTYSKNTHISNFGEDVIDFNGSKKKIKDLINDPAFKKVPLLHYYSDTRHYNFEDLGTIGSPKSHSFSDPTAALIGIQKEDNGKIYWCENQNFFVVRTGSFNDYNPCEDCVDYMAMVAAIHKKHEAIEQEMQKDLQ